MSYPKIGACNCACHEDPEASFNPQTLIQNYESHYQKQVEMLSSLASHLAKQALETGDLKAYAYHTAFNKGITAAHEAYVVCKAELSGEVQKKLDELRLKAYANKPYSVN